MHQDQPDTNDRRTPQEYLVALIADIGLKADLDAVRQVRGSGYIVRVGDITFRLKIFEHPLFLPALEVMNVRCKICGWANLLKVVHTLDDLTERIADHFAAHRQIADVDLGEQVPA